MNVMKLRIIGRKIGMSQIFTDKGELVPVTVLEVGPCPIVQVKTQDKDGYSAIQMAFEPLTKPWNVNKPRTGHFKKADMAAHRFLREMRLEADTDRKVGDKLTVAEFKTDELIDVTGTVKGRGYQGVMKRHGFGGHPDSHGQERHRAPGSIGASAWPSRVRKGVRMSGRMGGQTETVQNHTIVKIDAEKNLLLVKGSVPGANNSIVIVQQRQK
jgi:large subunit ribosomal protein L3